MSDLDTLLMIVACVSIVVAYVAWCLRRDRRADREHQAVVMALSPGPRIRDLTVPGMVRPNPLRPRKFAGGSQPVFPAAPASDFDHVPTDYGTYTPAQADAEILSRPDAGSHYHHAATSTCAEAPAQDAGHHASHHDACSTVDTSYDTSYGGFDGGGHHGH